MMPIVVLGNPEGRRIQSFQLALQNLQRPPATVIPYLDYLSGGKNGIPEIHWGDTLLRIESPGRNFEVEKQLLALGSDLAEAEGSPSILAATALQLTEDKGRILNPRQWYLGFCRLLEQIDAQVAEGRLMNTPADIALMFDKAQCQTHLAQHQVPIPPSLGSVVNFEDLVERMQQSDMRRVFVKLAHGSSASGVVALETNGQRWLATTSIELVRTGSIRLYNSRHIRRYNTLLDIAAIVDHLCRERVQVEAWIPKAGFENHRFDLRVLVIAGKAQHTVVRLSQTPLTNLHLLNQRRDPDGLRAQMGETAWIRAMQICEQAAATFPKSLYVGVDLVIPPGYRHPCVVEVNAFGDLLPGCLYKGVDSYTAEIQAMLPDSLLVGVR